MARQILLQHTSHAIMATAIDRKALLQQYAEDARAAFPAIQERSTKAVEIVYNSRIRRLDPAPVSGHDRWQADGSSGNTYEVSVQGGYCTCPDAQHNHVPQDPAYHGPLCKHRLAAMYMVKLGLSGNASADVLIARLMAEAEAEVRLYVRERWTGTTAKTAGAGWMAYRVDGGPQVDLPEVLDVGVGGHAFWQAIADAGWTRTGKAASHGGQHIWTLQPEKTSASAEDEDRALWA